MYKAHSFVHKHSISASGAYGCMCGVPLYAVVFLPVSGITNYYNKQIYFIVAG
jgi:hypothetical protein